MSKQCGITVRLLMSIALIFTSVCNRELGNSPIGTSVDEKPPVVNPRDTNQVIKVSRKFHVISSRSQLKADNSDTATITAILIDLNNNPAVGDSVYFSSNIGIIGQKAVVDSSGRARVTLRSSAINGICVIRASNNRTSDTASTVVIFSGIQLRLETDMTDQKINDFVTITALLKDGSGNAIGGDTVNFTTKNGTFDNGAASISTLLDPSGTAVARLTSKSARSVMVQATSLNTTDSISIVFTNNALGLTASPLILTVGGIESSTLTATYVDSSNKPVANVPVTFSTNAGTITSTTVNTNSSGKATTSLKSANFSGTAMVVASAPTGNAVIKIAFVSAVAAKIKLSISPDNISVNGGIASLTATVTDSNNNMVTGADVNFRILKGPGGGENIDKPVVTTQNGVAHAQIFAGSIPSMYRGCLISVTAGSISDTSKLTISGQPYAISVARPQSDTVSVPRGGILNDATFDYFVGAVVVDINGNPVADGTRVNFSMVVSGMAVHKKYFIKWAGLGSANEKYAVCSYGQTDIPFEDINNNFRMDENDLKLDYNDAVAARGDDVNGDGKCDFDPSIHDLWYDFNGNGIVDAGSTQVPTITRIPITRDTAVRVYKDTVIKIIVSTTPDTIYADSAKTITHMVIRTDTIGYQNDTTFTTHYFGAEPSIVVDGVLIWADLYPNGVWDTTEIVRDVNHNGKLDVPASGDRRWWELECLPFWQGVRFDFDRNDFGVAVTTSVTTQAGVANAHLTYPRQLARRLIVTVNAEANGVRDRNGERFTLPIIVSGK